MTPGIPQLLEAISGASSQKPAIAADVRKKLDLHIDDFASLFDAALSARLIYNATITRGGIEQLVLWPTGVILPVNPSAFVVSPSRRTVGIQLERNVGGPTAKANQPKPKDSECKSRKTVMALLKEADAPLTITDMSKRTKLPRTTVANLITRGLPVTGKKSDSGKALEYELTPEARAALEQGAASAQRATRISSPGAHA